MVAKADLLTAPPITPLSGVLLDHATIHEGIEWQDGDGLFESYNCITTDRRAAWPCPVITLAPPVQDALGSAAVGGELAAGTYYFTVTAINDNGETLESNEQSVTVAGATSTITVNWNLVIGATGYNIYWGVGAAQPKVKYAGMSDTDDTLLITGEFPAEGGAQPTSNTAVVEADPKTFEHPDWIDGQRFTVYAGIECKRFGDNGPEALAEVRRVFEARESFGVERGVIETVLQGADDLTPAGGAVTAKEGLAILEGDAAKTYAGVPTIHTPRVIASLLASETAIEAQGGKFYSHLGSKIAAGGGYDASNLSPDGDPAPDGELWLYASGEVLILRSKIIDADQLNRINNENLDLVERVYVVSVDCYKSAVRVKVTA